MFQTSTTSWKEKGVKFAVLHIDVWFFFFLFFSLHTKSFCGKRLHIEIRLDRVKYANKILA